MLNGNDCVMLSDDEPTDQIHQGSQTNRKERCCINNKIVSTIETIDLDEEPSNVTDNNNIIMIPNSKNSAKNDAIIAKLEKIHREDELFSDFIEKCLELENSDGMIRIVNKTVIKAYEESDKDYRKSAEFQRVLLKALRRLQADPDHKFSHVKYFVDTLKFHKVKKRVQLTTLATNLKKNGITMKSKLPKKSQLNSITLDSDEEDKDIPTINLDDDQNEVIVLDEKQAQEDRVHQEEIKENINLSNSQENFLIPREEVAWESLQVLPIEYEPPSTKAEEEEARKRKIEIVEFQIAQCKENISRLEETEVNDDSSMSPYLMCEKYKLQIVELYKELCKLVGEEPVKRRKVRLQVLEGHPPGPVRRLETFINDNIGEDGNPPFPDFCDVVKCVMVANIEDKLGWNKPQVMNEANALFTHCGRALQKQRQRREYRDLLAKVKVETADPADEDPELMRRLEQNRKVAVKNENDLLERYVKLQYLPPQKQKPGPNLEEPSEQICANDEPLVPMVDDEPLAPMVDDEHLAPMVGDEAEQPRPGSCCELISDEDSNFEPPEVKLSQEHITKTEIDTVNENKDSEETEVKIKEEPMDIVQMLEELGSDYTMTIIHIEDPFLVIEISSDEDESSDEDIVVEGESD